MRKYAQIASLLALIAWLAAYIGEPFFEAGYWFTLDAFAKFFLTGAVAIVATDYLFQVIANCLFILAGSNLLDELFFNPQSTGINEYLFASIVVVYACIKIVTMYAIPTKRNT
jgi:hypothetical protein